MNEGDMERSIISDERIPEYEKRAWAREFNSLDGDSFRALEALELNSFEDALYALDEFLESIVLFDGSNNFIKAANALDFASTAFTAIDANHDFVMTRAELESYLAGCSNEAIANPLSWLVANFNLLQGLSFFLNGITRHEIEAARDLFHGLNFLQANLETISSGKHGSLPESAVTNFVEEHEGDLEPHDARGLKGLAKFLSRLAPRGAGKKKRK